jgi:subtilisin family serine protease
VLALLLAATCLAGPQASVSAQAGEPVTRVAPAIEADLAAGREIFPVIVHIEAPPETRRALAPDPGLADELRRDAVAAALDAALRDLEGLFSAAERSSLRRFLLQPAFAAALSRERLLELLDRPGVLAVEPDLRFTVHTAEGLPLIGATALHDLGWSGEGTAVAIIDTGIDPLHPTLGGVQLPNGKVVLGLDTADLDSDPSDCSGHGTAVAAIAAGTSYQWSPQLRFAGGVAPEARILAYKASPDADCGAFPLSAVVLAIEDALLHRVGDGYRLAAINLSFGGGAFAGPCDAFAASYASAVAAATQAGVAIVASAGNEGLTGELAAPACVAEVLSVASVWDSDSGWVGYAFCLDPECVARCDDSFKPAGAVTCYSNSGALLDVLAPSEYLRAARAGGQITQFGGTSGAAAYVTGAVALLREAAPELPASALRQLLKLSGKPTLDPRNGLVRPRIDLERALAAVGHIHAAAVPGPTVPPGSPVPTVSTVIVDGPGLIGSVRVLLEMIHPAPERLEIALVAPSGTRVRLHHHGPGTIAAAGAGFHYDGVWGLYPDELDPVDSLGVLAGQIAAGSWHLEIVDSGPAGTGPELAELVGWALSIEPAEPPAPPTATTTVIPVVAHTAGAHGALWSSDLRVFNPSPDTTQTARLYFIPSSADGTLSYRQSELVLPQHSILDLPDIVARRFAAAAPRGSLILQTTAPGLVVSSRTFTTDGGSGSYGQFIGSVSPAQLTGLGEPPIAIGELGAAASVRTNFGLTEVAGASATVTVLRFHGNSGAPLGTPAVFTVAPFSNTQVGLEQPPGGGPAYAVVTVTAGAGRVSAYASLVDNGTGDAVFIPAVRTPPVERLLVPVVARQPGRGGTRWRSSLQLVNLGDAPTPLTLRFRPRQGSAAPPSVAHLSLLPGRAVAAADVVGEIFGLELANGSLEISLPDGPAPILATSRTYNATPAGSYGQAVPAVVAGIGQRAVITHVDGGGGQRTNLGVAEVAGLGARVRATLLDRHGRILGEPLILEPAPLELVQVDDVFAAAGAPPTWNCRIELEQLAGDGEVVAYASVVDAVTGDAIFVPAVAQPE